MNACTGRPLQEGVIGAAVGGAVSGAITATTGNTALASYAGTAAGSATEEIISYTRGEKELNWDNVKQSAVTVAKDTAIDGTIGIVTDRAIPKLKPKLVPNTKKEAVKNIIYDSPREFYVNTSTNVVTNGIKNISGGNKNSASGNVGAGAVSGLQLGGFKNPLFPIFKPQLGLWYFRS